MGSKAKRARRKIRREQPLVSPFLAQHGDYRQQFMPDPDEENRRRKLVSVVVNREVSTVDKWLVEGGEGFGEPQARAIEYCRRLWGRIGQGPPLVTNYFGLGVGGGGGDREGYLAALHELADLEGRLGMPDYWRTFEDMVRWNLAAGRAGGNMGMATSRQRARAKLRVGFVASKIAEWRRL